MSTKPITQQQVDYIRAHANDRPRVKVARDAGVSVSTLYRIVHEAGGEMPLRTYAPQPRARRDSAPLLPRDDDA